MKKIIFGSHNRSIWSIIMFVLTVVVGYLFINKYLILNFSEIRNFMNGNFHVPPYQFKVYLLKFIIPISSIIILADLGTYYFIKIFKKPNPVEMKYSNMFFVFLLQPLVGILLGMLVWFLAFSFDDEIWSLNSIIPYIILGEAGSLFLGTLFSFDAEFEIF